MSHSPGFLRHKEYCDGHLLEIRDNGDHRSLYFGPGHLQSRMSLSAPHTLVLSYTRHMVTSLLLQPEPRDILIVGIGAGSLVRFFAHNFPQCRIDGVDHAQHIFALARGYFGLPEDDRISLHCSDGLEFLQQSADKQYDLILVDAFDDQGMAASIYSAAFFALCSSRLKSDGVVSSNLWSSDSLLLQEIRTILADHFTSVLYCPVPERGNIIALAMNQAIPWCRFFLKNKEFANLSRRFGLDFKQLAAVAKTHNLSIPQQFLNFLRGSKPC